MNYSYATVVTDIHYAAGCCVLYRSLMDTKPRYPFVCLCPDTVDKSVKRFFRRYGVPYKLIRGFDGGFYKQDTGSKHDYWKKTLFKLKVFGLTDYEKIVFLDSDMVILKNLDHLFEKEHLSASAAGQSLHPDWVKINSGLMVIKPGESEYQGLLGTVEKAYIEARSEGEPFGDQDVINAYYDTWEKDMSLHLPETYNCLLGYAGVLKRKKIIDSAKDLYVYHFTGFQKPWSHSVFDRVKILLKICRRKGSLIDFEVYCVYRRLLRAL